MIKNDYIIRQERKEDYREVENLVREAFWNTFRPGCSEHYLLHILRDNADFIEELDFVMEKDGRIIGQNVFVKANIKADDGRNIPILTMGPISIAPDMQKKGYGKILLDYCLEKAAALGYGAVCLDGNINFYGKSGFGYSHDFGISYHGMPKGEKVPFSLCKELKEGYLDGVTGEYAPPECYFVSDSEVDEFDKGFPPKEKLRLPGQIF